jgi:ABC-type multidrug transport system fused ATPase/permease subunit
MRLRIPKPKITFSRFGQIYFTLKEIVKLSFKINPKLLISLLVLNTIWGLTSLPTFYLEKLLIDTLIEGVGAGIVAPIVRTLILLVLARFTIELIRNLLSSITRFQQSALTRYFSSELEVMMGKKMGELDMATIEDPEFRDKFNKIERESRRRAWALMVPLSDLPNYFAGFFSSFVVLVLLSPWIVVGVIVFSLPEFLISSRFIKKNYELHTKLSPSYRISGWLSYYLVQNRNFLELKILDLPGYLSNKLRRIQKQILGQQVALDKKRTNTQFLGYFPIVIFDIFVVIWTVFLVLAGEITVGSFQMYLRALNSIQSNMDGIMKSFTELYENYIYVVDLVWFLDLKPDIESDIEGEKLSSINSLEYKNVWFKYRDNSPWVLKDVDFKIEKGEKIAVVGENGAGKSTIIKLLGRFYDPSKGEVLVNGKKLEKLHTRHWRDNLAVLFQVFELYPFTAKEAIGYGDVKRINSEDEIKEAARKTGIDEFIEKLPLKYENPIAPEFEKGIMPSIGQWQRFGIARMLFRKNASVLVLDEPTSNVDPEAEEKIFKELVKITKGKILVFVTQRFSTVRIADRIFVVHKGTIVESGTHKELMDINGRYAKLYNLQAQAYK